MGNAGQSNYSATKSGLLGFTKSLAREVSSRNINVNAISPGFIDTDMTRALSKEQIEVLTKNINLLQNTINIAKKQKKFMDVKLKKIIIKFLMIKKLI